MADEAILRIPVDTGALDRMLGMITEYNAAVKKVPGLWEHATEEERKHLETLSKMAAVLSGQHQQYRDVNEDQKKHFGALANIKDLWSGIAKSSTSFANNITSVSRSILKWGALGLAGGLLGIDRLAESAAETGRQATGYGLQPGQLKAVTDVFTPRLGDQNPLLGWLAQMEADPRMWQFRSLTGHGVTHNTFQDLMALERSIATNAAQWSAQGRLQPMAEAYGIPLDVETLNRYAQNTGQMSKLIAQADTAAKQLAFDATTWQDFTQKVGTNWDQVMSALKRSTAAAIPTLEHLSDAIAKLATKALNSGWFENRVKDWTTGIETLADRPLQFLEDFGVSAPLRFGKWVVGQEAGALKNVFGGATADTLAGFKNYAAKFDQHFGLPAGLLEKVKQLESGTQMFGVQAQYGSGEFHRGIFQLSESLARQLGVDPDVPEMAAWGAGQYLSTLFSKYHGSIAETLAAYNMGPGALDALMSKWHGGWMQHLMDVDPKTKHSHKETAGYLTSAGINITLNDQTAGGLATRFAQQGTVAAPSY